MKFRYQLAKKTFKGKKIVEKGVEDLISEDQRGNDSSADIPSPLSLDKEAVTPVEPEEPKEVSRRDLFSFGRLGDFAEAVEEDRKNQPKKPRKEKVEESSEEPVENQEETPAIESIEEEPELVEEGTPKQGFFKRLISKFKSDPEAPQEIEAETKDDPEKKETFAQTLDKDEKELPSESNNIFELEEDEEDQEYD